MQGLWRTRGIIGISVTGLAKLAEPEGYVAPECVNAFYFLSWFEALYWKRKDAMYRRPL